MMGKMKKESPLAEFITKLNIEEYITNLDVNKELKFETNDSNCKITIKKNIDGGIDIKTSLRDDNNSKDTFVRYEINSDNELVYKYGNFKDISGKSEWKKEKEIGNEFEIIIENILKKFPATELSANLNFVIETKENGKVVNKEKLVVTTNYISLKELDTEVASQAYISFFENENFDSLIGTDWKITVKEALTKKIESIFGDDKNILNYVISKLEPEILFKKVGNYKGSILKEKPDITLGELIIETKKEIREKEMKKFDIILEKEDLQKQLKEEILPKMFEKALSDATSDPEAIKYLESINLSIEEARDLEIAYFGKSNLSEIISEYKDTLNKLELVNENPKTGELKFTLHNRMCFISKNDNNEIIRVNGRFLGSDDKYNPKYKIVDIKGICGEESTGKGLYNPSNVIEADKYPLKDKNILVITESEKDAGKLRIKAGIEALGTSQASICGYNQIVESTVDELKNLPQVSQLIEKIDTMKALAGETLEIVLIPDSDAAGIKGRIFNKMLIEKIYGSEIEKGEIKIRELQLKSEDVEGLEKIDLDTFLDKRIFTKNDSILAGNFSNAKREILGKEKYDELKNYSKEELETDIKEAVNSVSPAIIERINQAKEKNEKIYVVMDSDNDGVSSGVIIVDALKQYGIGKENIGKIFNSKMDTYGLKADKIPDDARMIICVDHGTNDRDAINTLMERGIDTIVIDHHEIDKEKVGDSTLIYNPKKDSMNEGIKESFTGCAASYVVAKALLKEKIELNNYIELIAGTLKTDMVPHNKIVNRILSVAMECANSPDKKRSFTAAVEGETGNHYRPNSLHFVFSRINKLIKTGNNDLAFKLLTICLYQESYEELYFKTLGEVKAEEAKLKELKNEMNKDIGIEIRKLEDEVILYDLKKEYNVLASELASSLINEKENTKAVLIASESEDGYIKISVRVADAVKEDISLDKLRETFRGEVKEIGGHKKAFGISVPLPKYTYKFRQKLESVFNNELELGSRINNEKIIPVELKHINEKLLSLQDSDGVTLPIADEKKIKIETVATVEEVKPNSEKTYLSISLAAGDYKKKVVLFNKEDIRDAEVKSLTEVGGGLGEENGKGNIIKVKGVPTVNCFMGHKSINIAIEKSEDLISGIEVIAEESELRKSFEKVESEIGENKTVEFDGKLIHTKSVGISFSKDEDISEFLKNRNDIKELCLKRDPSNPHDSKAVIVGYVSGDEFKKIGFITRNSEKNLPLNSLISDIMDNKSDYIKLAVKHFNITGDISIKELMIKKDICLKSGNFSEALKTSMVLYKQGVVKELSFITSAFESPDYDARVKADVKTELIMMDRNKERIKKVNVKNIGLNITLEMEYTKKAYLGHSNANYSINDVKEEKSIYLTSDLKLANQFAKEDGKVLTLDIKDLKIYTVKTNETISDSTIKSMGYEGKAFYNREGTALHYKIYNTEKLEELNLEKDKIERIESKSEIDKINIRLENRLDLNNKRIVIVKGINEARNEALKCKEDDIVFHNSIADEKFSKAETIIVLAKDIKDLPNKTLAERKIVLSDLTILENKKHATELVKLPEVLVREKNLNEFKEDMYKVEYLPKVKTELTSILRKSKGIDDIEKKHAELEEKKTRSKNTIVRACLKEMLTSIYTEKYFEFREVKPKIEDSFIQKLNTIKSIEQNNTAKSAINSILNYEKLLSDRDNLELLKTDIDPENVLEARALNNINSLFIKVLALDSNEIKQIERKILNEEIYVNGKNFTKEEAEMIIEYCNESTNFSKTGIIDKLEELINKSTNAASIEKEIELLSEYDGIEDSEKGMLIEKVKAEQRENDIPNLFDDLNLGFETMDNLSDEGKGSFKEYSNKLEHDYKKFSESGSIEDLEKMEISKEDLKEFLINSKSSLIEAKAFMDIESYSKNRLNSEKMKSNIEKYGGLAVRAIFNVNAFKNDFAKIKSLYACALFVIKTPVNLVLNTIDHGKTIEAFNGIRTHIAKNNIGRSIELSSIQRLYSNIEKAINNNDEISNKLTYKEYFDKMVKSEVTDGGLITYNKYVANDEALKFVFSPRQLSNILEKGGEVLAKSIDSFISKYYNLDNYKRLDLPTISKLAEAAILFKNRENIPTNSDAVRLHNAIKFVKNVLGDSIVIKETNTDKADFNLKINCMEMSKELGTMENSLLSILGKGIELSPECKKELALFIKVPGVENVSNLKKHLDDFIKTNKEEIVKIEKEKEKLSEEITVPEMGDSPEIEIVDKELFPREMKQEPQVISSEEELENECLEEVDLSLFGGEGETLIE